MIMDVDSHCGRLKRGAIKYGRSSSIILNLLIIIHIFMTRELYAVSWRIMSMANTYYLKSVVETYIRNELGKKYGIAFSAKTMLLPTGGTHEFDAVSSDGRIVVAVKSASGKTAGGKNPSGKIKDVEAELYYLLLIQAPVRILVLTSEGFYRIMRQRLDGRLADGIKLQLMLLPPEIQEQVNQIQQIASKEVMGQF